MKKRYLVMVLLLGFGVLFGVLLSEGTKQTRVSTGAPTLAPDALPAQKDDLILVTAPLPQATVTSPLVIKGKARGNWYFEGSFPVSLVATDGTVLAEGHASAQGEWMTTDYVPFVASLEYTVPQSVTDPHGFVILRKDNPSGEPQFDNSLSVPVTLQ